MTTLLAPNALFIANLKKGKTWEAVVAERFNEAGFDAKATKLKVRPKRSLRHQYADNGDVIVASKSKHHPWVFEVKSREIKFGPNPLSYPYEWAFVINVRPWEGKRRKPHAILLISRITGAILVVPTTSFEHWREGQIVNRVQDVDQRLYECPRQLLRTWEELLEWMRKETVT